LVQAGAEIDGIDDKGDSSLLLAYMNRQKDTATALIELGADVRCKGRGGRTALHWASENGDTAAVKALVQAGAEIDGIDDKGDSPLVLASRNGNVAMAKALLAMGADVRHKSSAGKTSLHVASSAGHMEAANVLAEAGASMSSEDNEGRTVLDVASAEVVKALMESKRTNEVALRMAAREGRTATVRSTLATAVDVDLNGMDKDGWTALHFASDKGHTETATALIESRANVHSKSKDGYARHAATLGLTLCRAGLAVE
jgi:ankyrin repeat protein